MSELTPAEVAELDQWREAAGVHFDETLGEVRVLVDEHGEPAASYIVAEWFEHPTGLSAATAAMALVRLAQLDEATPGGESP